MRGRLRGRLRQWRHYREFRIAAGSPGDPAGVLEQVRAAVSEMNAADPTADAGPPAGDAAGVDEGAVAAAATSLWRAQYHASQGDRSWQARQTDHHLTAARDALQEAGVTIQDHDGDRFHRGMSLDVVAVQDDPDVGTEVVVQTVRPSVYLHDRRIQTGQVVVARPPRESVRLPRRPSATEENEHA